MNTQKKQGFFSNMKYDLPASVVVFLVALPLCLGIALASGAPLFSGIIAGIVGGTVVALLSGSPLGVSGPAAGLAVIVLNAIHELGAFEIFLFAVVIAGVFQIILGILKAGIIGYYFPSSVIKGMLAGIGIIIFIKEVPYALGKSKYADGNMIEVFTDLFASISLGPLIITIISLAILILWEQSFIKKASFSRIIQGPLVAVLAGIGLNLLFQNMGDYALQSKQLVTIPVAESIGGFFQQFTFPDFSQWNNPEIYVVAATIAVVASLETLLCVEATDKLDPFKRVTPTNRELLAQGVGNFLSGMIGGLPVTQVIIRSSTNIQSGGRTKASAFFHGVLLLMCVMTIPFLLNLIPLASLAAILFMVGYKLAKPILFKKMYAKGWMEFVPFIVTIVGIVFTDLLIGIGMGLVVAVFFILWNNYKTPYHFNPENYVKGEPILIQLSEDVSFLNKASIQNTLDHLPDESIVIIDAGQARSIHPDIIEIIEDFQQNAKIRNIGVELHGFEDSVKHDPVHQFGKTIAPKLINKNKNRLGKVLDDNSTLS